MGRTGRVLATRNRRCIGGLFHQRARRKARARAERWHKEVQLLCEEMRRCIAYLRFRAQWWRNLAAAQQDSDIVTLEGRRAYAFEQAAFQDALGANWLKRWSPIVACARSSKLLDGVHSLGELDVINGSLSDPIILELDQDEPPNDWG